jgi:hypothetical protein
MDIISTIYGNHQRGGCMISSEDLGFRPYMREIIGKKVQIHLFEYRVLSEILPFQGPFLSNVVGYDDFGLWVEPDEFVQEKKEGDIIVEYPTRLAIRWNLIKSIVFLGPQRIKVAKDQQIKDDAEAAAGQQ